MLSAGILSFVFGTVLCLHFGESLAALIIGSALTSCGVSMIINGEFSYRRKIKYLENEIVEIRKKIRK